MNYADHSGYMPEWLGTTLKILAGVTIIAGCVVGSIFTGGTLSVVLAGAVSGAVAASSLGMWSQAGINAAISMANYAGTQALGGNKITVGGLLTSGAFGFACGFIGQNGWMQEWKTCAFITFSGRNALKHVVSMVGTETLLRMTIPALVIGGVGGGAYGRLSEFLNPNGYFVGI